LKEKRDLVHSQLPALGYKNICNSNIKLREPVTITPVAKIT
jgi:hypothetical protein